MVAPDIVDVEIPRDDNGVIRRGLMVIAKIIQNLANNIFFGKEAYMVSLNDFLRANIVNVTRYLSEVNVRQRLPVSFGYSYSVDRRDRNTLRTVPKMTTMNGWAPPTMIPTQLSYIDISKNTQTRSARNY